MLFVLLSDSAARRAASACAAATRSRPICFRVARLLIGRGGGVFDEFELELFSEDESAAAALALSWPIALPRGRASIPNRNL